VSVNAINSTTGTNSSGSSSVTLDGSLVVNILGQNYTLEGTLSGTGSGSTGTGGVNVEYHKEFDQAINLGPVSVIAGQIASALGFQGVSDEITQAMTTLKALPVIGTAIADLVDDASARITDLVINTSASTYEVGLALDFSLAPPTVLGIELMAIGFKVTSSPKTQSSTPPTPGSNPPVS
jgi:hypothetical protein